MAAMILGILASLWYAQKGDAPKTSFDTLTANIVAITDVHPRYPGRSKEDRRFIYTDNYPYPFEIFIGKAPGDFSPKFEKIDSLRDGDSITLFFEETNKTARQEYCNTVRYIDRGTETVFIEGNSKKNLVYGLAIFCALFAGFLLYLKRAGKIQ